MANLEVKPAASPDLPAPVPTAKVVSDPGDKNTQVTVSEVPPTEGDPKKAAGAGADRPGWLPEKFKSPEELAKAYQELSSKLGKPKGEEGNDAAPTQEEALKIVKDAGLDMAKLSDEFREKGELSAESLKALKSKGITEDVVQNYVEGQKARSAAYRADLAKTVGGEEALEGLFEWARTGLAADEIEAADAVLASGNAGASKLLLQGLQAKYEAANGKEPGLLEGEAAEVAGVKPYGDTTEMMNDMSTKLYKESEAERKRVQKRLAKSQLFG